MWKSMFLYNDYSVYVLIGGLIDLQLEQHY